MKYKKLVGVCFCFFLMVIVFFYYFDREPFQPSVSTKDILTILDSFCNKHYGEEQWNMDSLVVYNENLVFVVIQTKKNTIELSIQPDIRTIIIENSSYDKTNTRIFRY